MIKTVRKKIKIELFPIIRIRGGDFLFSDEEFEVMLHEVEACKSAGCEGVVIGMLMPDGRVDKIHCSRLVEKAYPMGVCFHRAFDWTEIHLKPWRISLTSVAKGSLLQDNNPLAILGAHLIRDLVIQSDGRIQIMPGSGVRAANIIRCEKRNRRQSFSQFSQDIKKIFHGICSAIYE